MSEKILVPALGESITEATVSKWLKNEGDAVNVDEAIVELETDKVNLEVPSPSSGILTEIKSKDGDTVEVGAVLGTISQENIKVEKKEKVTKPKEQKIEKVELPEKKSNIINLEIEKKTETKNEEPLVLLEEEPLVLTEEIESSQNLNQPVVLSPAVRKMVAEKKINIDELFEEVTTILKLETDYKNEAASLLKYAENFSIFNSNLTYNQKLIACDAQTSGGLLITLSNRDANKFVEEFGKKAKIIGKITSKKNKSVNVEL